jgi:hypothetical protein
MPHGRHIKEERKEIRIGNSSLGSSGHQTEDAAFTHATPHDLQHSRANTDSNNSHNTQHTRVTKIILRFKQEATRWAPFFSNKKSRIAQELESEIGRVTRLWLGVIERLGIDPASETASPFYKRVRDGKLAFGL